MKGKKILNFLFVFFLVFGAPGYGNDSELLKTADVHKIMQQILTQHIGEKQMNAKIIKEGMRIYIDQFDPFRIYLLDDEVQPFLQPTANDVSKDLEEYSQGKFDEFKDLNDVIQKAIARARVIREAVEKNRNDLFNTALTSTQPDFSQDPDLKMAFAKNPKELETRIKNNIKRFISDEKNKYGAEKISQNQSKTLLIYNRYFENLENSYLFTNSQNQPLSPVQQENLFTLHVLKALAGSLDAHTTFYNKTEAYDIKVHLEKGFEGVGIVLEQVPNGAILIKSLIDGGPAAKSGIIKAEDQIVSIDGKSTENASLQDVMEQLRGKNGTPVQLVLQRKGEESQGQPNLIKVKLIREEITLNDDRAKFTYENFGNGIIGKVTLNSFYQGENGISSVQDVKNAIKELKQKGNLRGLILDLRDNGGGFLNQAVQVAGLFITNGVVVISKYSDGNERYYRDMDNSAYYTGPLVILTSKATASAAEIVAQALQDYGVALVVGDERTYGKGTIQSQTVTDDSTSTYFKVTVGEYYTVSGKTPQINGVKSDILVPGKLSEEHIGEKYLENALPADSIAPEYKDDLKDVDPSLKQWYLRYYYSTLQPKIETWTKMLPALKRNSAYRIEHNKNYQTFIHQLKGIKEESSDEEMEAGANEPVKKNFGVNDLQINEAFNIVKDMIMLHAQDRTSSVAAENTQTQ
jgi:carboxyl-terminal processing protease